MRACVHAHVHATNPRGEIELNEDTLLVAGRTVIISRLVTSRIARDGHRHRIQNRRCRIRRGSSQGVFLSLLRTDATRFAAPRIADSCDILRADTLVHPSILRTIRIACATSSRFLVPPIVLNVAEIN